MTCLLLAAISLVTFTTTQNYALGLAALFLASLASTFAGVGTQTVLNIESRPEMLGRVMGVYSALVRGAPAAGGMLIGFLAPLIGFAGVIGACAFWAGLYGIHLAVSRRP